MTKLHYFEYDITAAEEGMQVKTVLSRTLGFTAAKIRSAKFDSNGILLDGVRVPVTTRVRCGERLSLLLNDSEERSEHLLPCPMDLDILYEDEDILILNKPAGTVCHPSKGHLTDSLSNGILAYYHAKEERSSIHLLGRLDKDTSGVLTIAKNGATADFLAREREEGILVKTYYCLCVGHPESSGIITTPMRSCRTEEGTLKMCAASAEEGMDAYTSYETLQTYPEGFALCRVTIRTGRTHQIRFHMSSIDHPLLGDPLYGTAAQIPGTGLIGRTALHAGSLHFVHPYKKTAMHITAPLPKDFSDLL